MSPLAPRVQALPQRFNDTNLDHHVPAGLIAPRSFKNPWPSDRSPLNPLMLANTFTDPAPSEKDIVDPQTDDSDKDGHPVRNLGTTMMDEGKGHVRGMWLGHASFLILFPSRLSEREVGVLFDPVFEDRCSPSGWFGPIRDVKPPLDIASLPVGGDASRRQP
jgi:N-acyl-phosphatidylethanolamine-hydrolysing phospholipase D